MAVFDVFKTLTDQQALCESVENFARVHRDDLVDALMELVREDLGEGEPMPEIGGFVDLLIRRLRRALEAYKGKEAALLKELGIDNMVRRERDAWFVALVRVFFDARGMVRHHFGPEQSDDVGFPRQVSQRPLGLLRQVERVFDTVTDPRFEIEPRYAETEVTVESIVAILEPHYSRLRAALDRLSRETGKTHGAQVAKDRQRDEFGTIYVLFVVMLEAAFKLAGKPELADRFRPTIARRPTVTPLPGPVPGDGPAPPSDDGDESPDAPGDSGGDPGDDPDDDPDDDDGAELEDGFEIDGADEGSEPG